MLRWIGVPQLGEPSGSPNVEMDDRLNGIHFDSSRVTSPISIVSSAGERCQNLGRGKSTRTWNLTTTTISAGDSTRSILEAWIRERQRMTRAAVRRVTRTTSSRAGRGDSLVFWKVGVEVDLVCANDLELLVNDGGSEVVDCELDA
jgi:hypothetical protein